MVAHVTRGDGERGDRHLGEDVRRLSAEVYVIRIREGREWEVGLMLIDLGDPLRLWDRSAAQKNCVDETEDRCVCANAKGQRQERDDRKAGALPSAAKGEADVADD